MNIRPILPQSAYAPSASKETSEDERKKSEQRGGSKKKRGSEKIQKNDASHDATQETQPNPDENLPKSSQVIELLSHRQESISPSQGQQAFTRVAKTSVSPTKTEDPKLDKKY